MHTIWLCFNIYLADVYTLFRMKKQWTKFVDLFVDRLILNYS